MTKESCTKVVSLAGRRYQKNQQEVWEELVKATAALKAAESHLLRAHIAMAGARWSEHKIEDVKEWANWCQQAEYGSHSFLRLVCAILGYEDPFDSAV